MVTKYTLNTEDNFFPRIEVIHPDHPEYANISMSWGVAKGVLINHIRDRLEHWREQVQFAKKLKKSDINEVCNS